MREQGSCSIGCASMKNDDFTSIACQVAEAYSKSFPPLQSERLEALKIARASSVSLSTSQDHSLSQNPSPAPCRHISVRSKFHAAYEVLQSALEAFRGQRRTDRVPCGGSQADSSMASTSDGEIRTPNVKLSGALQARLAARSREYVKSVERGQPGLQGVRSNAGLGLGARRISTRAVAVQPSVWKLRCRGCQSCPRSKAAAVARTWDMWGKLARRQKQFA